MMSKFTLLMIAYLLCFVNMQSVSGNRKEEDIFVATYDWQIIKEEQAIPKGLHIRINLQTGLREAKLIDPAEDNKGSALSSLQPEESKEEEKGGNSKKYTTEELEHVLQNIKSDETTTRIDSDEIIKDDFKSYDQLKQELGELHLSVKTDNEILIDLIIRYEKIHSDENLDIDEKNTQIIRVLQDIEYLVHQIDNANDFISLNGFPIIVYSNLNNSNLLIKCEALNILGSTVQNNARAQIYSLETGSIDKLIKILALRNPQEAKIRAVYSLSSLLRRFPLAQSQFVENGGLDVFSTIFVRPENSKIQLKIITLLYDLLIEHKNALEDVNSVDYKKIVNQYNLVDLKSKLIEFGWCKTFNSFFINNLLIEKADHDSVEKCLNFMFEIVDSCATILNNGQLVNVLKELHNNYATLSQEEIQENTGDDYFNNLKQITYNLLTIIGDKQKSEL